MITTNDYIPNKSAEDDAILRQLEYGNGLPTLRNHDDVIQAAKAGFNILVDNDLAQDRNDTIPWYNYLNDTLLGKLKLHIIYVFFTEWIGLAPKGNGRYTSCIN